MGKMNSSSLLQRYKSNVRVDPASLSHYLCYYCGKMSSDRLEYQQHMLKVHEVLSQSYQLWSDHMMDSLGLRWSESRGRDDRETSCSLPASPISRESKSHNTDDDDEDYVYEEARPVKRRKKDEEKSKRVATLAAEKQKRILEEQKKKMEAESEKKRKAEEKRLEKARRDDEKRRIDEEKKVSPQQEAPTPEKDVAAQRSGNAELGDAESPLEAKPEVEKRKRRKTESSRWREIQSEGDKPEITALVKKILEESKKKEASSHEVEEEELTAELSSRKPLDHSLNTLKYCKVCKKGTHFTFSSLFEHYQDHHHATIKSFHYYGYEGNQLIGKKLLLSRDYCQRCVVKFPRERDYFSHMIHNHIHESVRCQLDFENATNADVETQLVFRERTIALGYNFKFYEESVQDAPAFIDSSETSDSTLLDSFSDPTCKLEEPEELAAVTDVPAEEQSESLSSVKLEEP